MIEIEILQVSSTTSEVLASDHKLLIDNDLSQDGNNNGVNGSQLFLMSVGGDLMNHLLGVISEKNAPISQVNMKVIGHMNEQHSKYISIDLLLSAQYEDKDHFKQLISSAQRKSLVIGSITELININIRVS